MNNPMVTVLVDDVSHRDGILAEHGLAILVQTDNDSVLLDTGQSGDRLLRNAAALGVRLSAVSALVLSHGHYDHTGGVPAFLGTNRNARILLHPRAMSPRFRRLPRRPHRAIGIPAAASAALESVRDRITWTTGPTEVAAGVFATGPIPRAHDFEKVTTDFFSDAECRSRDDIPDDQAIWISTRSGPIVVVGCAHAGIVNTLDYVRKLSGASAVRAVIGGLHLMDADAERLALTCAALRDRQLDLVAPCHCTGKEAVAFLSARLYDQFRPCSAGERFERAPDGARPGCGPIHAL